MMEIVYRKSDGSETLIASGFDFKYLTKEGDKFLKDAGVKSYYWRYNFDPNIENFKECIIDFGSWSDFLVVKNIQ